MNEPVVQRDKLETLDTNRDQPVVEQHQEQDQEDVEVQNVGRVDPNLYADQSLENNAIDQTDDELQDAINDVNNQE